MTENGTVYWDFDASRPCAWDTSAAMIATSGMLLINQLDPTSNLLPAVAKILKHTISEAWGQGDTILEHSIINNNGDSTLRLSDNGLVYADYYFLETGNRLLEQNLISI